MSDRPGLSTRPTIPDWPAGERPREKLLQLGPRNLSDAELIAILLRTGSREHSAVELARQVLAHTGSLRTLSELEHPSLFRLHGIGEVKGLTLIAAFELSRRLASLPLPPRLKITDPEAVFRTYAPRLAHLKKEVFMILILSSANGLVRDVQLSEGILNSSLVHPREVFRTAILDTAASIILLHNHPSGEVMPSGEDRQITQRLVEAGKLLNIPVLDHIIIGGNRYYSFREAGLIGDPG